MSPNESMPLTAFAVAVAAIGVLIIGAKSLHERSRKLGYDQCVAEQDDDRPRPTDDGEGVPGYR